MSSQRIGEYLRNVVPLSDHDIEEIIQEQAFSRQRFGDTALSLGKCEPQHLWQAWTEQLSTGRRTIDLETVGLDTQTLTLIPPDLAQLYQFIPVRACGNELIVAVASLPDELTREHLQRNCKLRLIFALADARKIHQLLDEHYHILAA